MDTIDTHYRIQFSPLDGPWKGFWRDFNNERYVSAYDAHLDRCRDGVANKYRVVKIVTTREVIEEKEEACQ